MSDPYVYTDSDGVLLSIGPMPGGDGAWLTLTRTDLHIAAKDAPEVCARILKAAGRDTDRPDLDAIAAREQAASKEVARLCNGGRWEMQVPARDDADSDMVISRSLSDIDVLLEEVRRLRAELDDAEYGAQRALTQALESRELRKQASDYITELKRELATARREERERCAAKLAAHSNAATELGNYRGADAFAHAGGIIRALPDEDTPACGRDVSVEGGRRAAPCVRAAGHGGDCNWKHATTEESP